MMSLMLQFVVFSFCQHRPAYRFTIWLSERLTGKEAAQGAVNQFHLDADADSCHSGIRPEYIRRAKFIIAPIHDSIGLKSAFFDVDYFS
jgi:hypothetical protein